MTRNHISRMMNELMGEVRDYLLERNKELQLKYEGFMSWYLAEKIR